MRLETNTEELEREVRKELEDMHGMLRQIVDYQSLHEPALKSLDNIMGAGMVMRWVVIVIIGSMAAIGTAATALEAVRAWLK